MLIGQCRDIYFKTQSLISSILFTYNKDRKFAKLPQTCSEKWPQIRMIVSHLQHQNIIHFLAWMNSKLHYKKLKRQQFNNSWNTPLQSGVEQREVPQSDGLSAKIHKHKVVAPLSMDSAKVPREPFSAVLGMDLAQSLHPCYPVSYTHLTLPTKRIV